MKKIIISLFLLVFLISFVSSEISYVSDVPSDDNGRLICKLGQECNIRSICHNQFAVAGSGATMTLSLFNPNKTILIDRKNMTRTDSYYVYNFTPYVIGTYTGVIYCKEITDDGSNSLEVVVTPTGEEFTTAQSILYGIMFVVVLFILIACIYLFVVTPYENNKGVNGELIAVNYKKYLKIFMFLMAYVCFLALSFFAWNISFAFLYFNAMERFFYFVYRTSFVLLLPGFILTCLLAIINFVNDRKLEKEMEKIFNESI